MFQCDWSSVRPYDGMVALVQGTSLFEEMKQ